MRMVFACNHTCELSFSHTRKTRETLKFGCPWAYTKLWWRRCDCVCAAVIMYAAQMALASLREWAWSAVVLLKPVTQTSTLLIAFGVYAIARLPFTIISALLTSAHQNRKPSQPQQNKKNTVNISQFWLLILQIWEKKKHVFFIPWQ